MSVTRASIFCIFVLLIAGCSFAPSPYPKLRITNQTSKSEPSVDLSMSAEDLASISQPGYTLRRCCLSDSRENCFILSFSESQAPISSIHGSYQFYSEKQAPLELVYFNNNVALLVPRQDIITKASHNYSIYSGFMKFGKYKLEVQYESEGSSHSCLFDVDYFRNNTPELHGIWELKDVD